MKKKSTFTFFTHRAVNILGKVAALAAGIVGQARSTLLFPRMTIGTDVILAAWCLTTQVDDVLWLEGGGTVVGHTVHILGEVTAIRGVVVLESIVALA